MSKKSSEAAVCYVICLPHWSQLLSKCAALNLTLIAKLPLMILFFFQFSTVCVGWRGTASLKLIIDISNWFCCYAVHVPFSA